MRWPVLPGSEAQEPFPDAQRAAEPTLGSTSVRVNLFPGKSCPQCRFVLKLRKVKWSLNGQSVVEGKQERRLSNIIALLYHVSNSWHTLCVLSMWQWVSAAISMTLHQWYSYWMCNLHVTNFRADRAQSFVIYNDQLNSFIVTGLRNLLSRVVNSCVSWSFLFLFIFLVFQNLETLSSVSSDCHHAMTCHGNCGGRPQKCNCPGIKQQSVHADGQFYRGSSCKPCPRILSQ